EAEGLRREGGGGGGETDRDGGWGASGVAGTAGGEEATRDETEPGDRRHAIVPRQPGAARPVLGQRQQAEHVPPDRQAGEDGELEQEPEGLPQLIPDRVRPDRPHQLEQTD